MIAFALSLVLAGYAPVDDEGWKSGWGMGVSMAHVEKGPGNSIEVTCGERQTAVSFALGGDTPKGDSEVLLTFDNRDPVAFSMSNGRIDSDCHACAGNFDEIIRNLKRHSSVHVRFTNGMGTRFTLRGSSAAIGDCPADFWQ